MSSEKLDKLFEDVFRRPVANDQDIFELGANSLTAIQLVSQVNETFGANINMEQFFLSPCKQNHPDQLPAAATARYA